MRNWIKYLKQWRKDNKKKISKYKKQYRIDHKEEIAERDKQYQKDNKKRCLGICKRYKKTPAGKASSRAYCSNRRALTKGLTKKVIQRVYEDNIKKYGTLTCVLCFKPIEFGEDSLEHLTPISRGGNNDYDNLGIAHLSCNKKKQAKTLKEWITNKKEK